MEKDGGKGENICSTRTAMQSNELPSLISQTYWYTRPFKICTHLPQLSTGTYSYEECYICNLGNPQFWLHLLRRLSCDSHSWKRCCHNCRNHHQKAMAALINCPGHTWHSLCEKHPPRTPRACYVKILFVCFGLYELAHLQLVITSDKINKMDSTSLIFILTKLQNITTMMGFLSWYPSSKRRSLQLYLSTRLRCYFGPSVTFK